MSGGFFRGTSADQDTRFSNKQAKLLKSQKFAPELEFLVDMTKVKMDVIRPWIATRATELLGFEDEVLINFVYGLLDGKEVDGKKIQIQLTGFMEKNTGKFMKDLWTLLLSAQNNVSGVPQQFLDAKEEEQRKKKEENDRITQEIQKRKERAGRELERDKPARMDDEDNDLRSHNTGLDSLSKPRASCDQPEEERKEDGSHTRKTRNGNSSSPYGNNHSPLLQRSSPSAARSNSREGHKSRSSSIYSQSPRHSISPRRRYHSPIRQSLSPVMQYRSPHRRLISRSPIRRRSPHSRRRSISRSRNRSPSPYWRRSHVRRRSPYLYRRSPTSLHRRSPSPVRRRSPPLRRRSPSPIHRRSLSPTRRRSPVQVRRRSPFSYRHRSPIRRGLQSPGRVESLSPIRRRSPLSSSSKYRKQSPPRSPVSRHADLYVSPKQRNRSFSPHGSQSPLNHMGFNKEHINLVDRDKSGRPSDKRTQKRLSAQYDMDREPAKYDGSDKSPSHSKSQAEKRSSSRKYSRSPSSSRSPIVRRGESTSRHGSSDTNREEERTTSGRKFSQHKNGPSSKQKKDSHPDMNLKKPYANDNSSELFSPDISAAVQSPSLRRLVKPDIKHDTGDRLKGQARNNLQSVEEIEYGPGGAVGGKNRLDDVKLFPRDKSPEGMVTKEHALRSNVGHNTFSNVHSFSKSIEYEETHREREHGKMSKRKLHMDIQMNSTYSDSEEAQDIDKQKHRRSDSKRNISGSSETDSQAYDKKETKRRRKEEKRLRKEEKRRRREERRQRRLERRAAKQKTRAMDASSPSSSFEKHHKEVCESDGDKYLKKLYKSTAEDAESEQKRLEIELRKKALESLRAKKSIND